MCLSHGPPLVFGIPGEKQVCAPKQNATPWTLVGNPATGPGSGDSFQAQSTFVLPWNDSMAVVMMDRWHSPGGKRKRMPCGRLRVVFTLLWTTF